MSKFKKDIEVFLDIKENYLKNKQTDNNFYSHKHKQLFYVDIQKDIQELPNCHSIKVHYFEDIELLFKDLGIELTDKTKEALFSKLRRNVYNTYPCYVLLCCEFINNIR